ncbi:MAG: MFS transporter [Planctomycetota bacterium]|nr:MAG: MFS transporter [Planctomycetota bacterium]
MASSPFIRLRLRVMMFLQFFVWATWMVPIAAYGPQALGLDGAQMGWIFSCTAIAAMISPLFVGYVADRWFATERILCLLHLLGGGLMIAAGLQTSFWPFFGLLLASTLCYMPTLALANSLTFANIDDANTFSWIAVFGTIGWIVSGWIVGLAIGETNATFFTLAGGIEIALGLYCLTLPHTPPKGKEAGGDVLGLNALRLLKDPSFSLFVVSAFLISIPAVQYFVQATLFLAETDRPAPATLMTLCQFSEIFVMATLPLFIARFGLERVLAIGMGMWAIRYLAFSTLNFPLVILALLVHGFCYCFVYVGSFIYVDTKVPQELRASAQSFISFLMLGVGWFLGSHVAGFVSDLYPPQVQITTTVQGSSETTTVPMPAWPKLVELLDTDDDGLITTFDLDAIDPEAKEFQDKFAEVAGNPPAYNFAELDMALQDLDTHAPVLDKGDVAAVVASQMRISKEAYTAACVRPWHSIWQWPALFAGVVCVIFSMTLGGSKPSEDGTDAETESENSGDPADEPSPSENDET